MNGGHKAQPGAARQLMDKSKIERGGQAELAQIAGRSAQVSTFGGGNELGRLVWR